MKNVSPEMLSYILAKIVYEKEYINSNNTKEKIIQKYKQNNFDTIKLVISTDNIEYQRNFEISYQPQIAVREYMDTEIRPQPISSNEQSIMDELLCYEISFLEIANSYSVNKFISFDDFKKLFFKLPYLSDLFHVSYSHMNQNKHSIDREFDNFVVSVEFDNYPYGVFYFPEVIEDLKVMRRSDTNEENVHEMRQKIKLSDTVDGIIKKIMEEINNQGSRINPKDMQILTNLRNPNQLSCSIYNYTSNHEEQIGYFESLYSSVELMDATIGKIKISYNTDLMSLNSRREAVVKENGYCKVFYGTKGDFQWKKCQIMPGHVNDAKLVSRDYKTKLSMNKDDIVKAYNF